MSRNVEIATTILEQLGGNRVKVMTGAKHFMAIDNGLSFRLPTRMARDGINCVEIRLNSSDTYDVSFKKIGNMPTLKAIAAGADPVPKVTTVKVSEGVYCDMLRDVFEASTGLYLSL